MYCKFSITSWFARLLIICTLLTSCDNKRATYHDLKALNNELRLHSANYTIADWETAINEYEKIHSRMEKYDYTPEEIREIGRIEGEMAGYMTQEVINALKKETVNILYEASGFVEGFKKAFDNK